MPNSPVLLNSTGWLTEYLPPELIQSAGQDRSVLVVFKPAFYRCQLPDDHPEDSLVSWLVRRYTIPPELMDDELNPALSGGGGFGPLCHRLDKETSGPVLVARTIETWKFIRHQFQREQVQKRYVCLVSGTISRDSGVIDSPIRVRRTDKHTSAEIGSGPACSSAHSEFRVLERYEEGCTLVSVKITTGVTHQIRVHMAQGLGHPIVGDRKYGSTSRQPDLSLVTRVPDRVFLHCYELGFRSEKDSDHLTTIKCSLPTELRNLLWSLTPTSTCPIPPELRALLAGLLGLPLGAASRQWHIPYSSLTSRVVTALVSGEDERVKDCNSNTTVRKEMQDNLQISRSAQLSSDWFFSVHPELFKRDLKKVEGITVRDTSDKLGILKAQYPSTDRSVDALKTTQIAWGLKKTEIAKHPVSVAPLGVATAKQPAKIRIGKPAMKPRSPRIEPKKQHADRSQPAYARVRQDFFQTYDYGKKASQPSSRVGELVNEVVKIVANALPSDGTYVTLTQLIEDHTEIRDILKLNSDLGKPLVDVALVRSILATYGRNKFRFTNVGVDTKIAHKS